MKKCLKITVIGNVQQVGYRAFVQEVAEKCHIEGTVQNMPDKSVLIHACGDPAHLEEFIDYLYQGTKKSSIEEILQESLSGDKTFRGVFRAIGD